MGGRILTRREDAAHYDLGPTWFWPGQPRIAVLTERRGLSRFDQFSQGDVIFENEQGRVHRGRGYASMQGAWRLEGGIGALIAALELKGFAATTACFDNDPHTHPGSNGDQGERREHPGTAGGSGAAPAHGSKNVLYGDAVYRRIDSPGGSRNPDGRPCQGRGCLILAGTGVAPQFGGYLEGALEASGLALASLKT